MLHAGVDEATGTPWLAMELLRGEDLAVFIQRKGRLTAGEVEQVRRRNEERRASVLETFAAAGLDYVDVSSGDPVSIHASFLRWADARLVHGGRLG